MPVVHFGALGAIAAYLKNLPADKGWWYRLPGVGHSKASYESDSIFPPLGDLFGLHDDAMIIFLENIGLITVARRQNRTQIGTDETTMSPKKEINKKAWDDLKSLYSVQHLLELAPCKYHGSKLYFVRIGRLRLGPLTILNMFKKDPQCMAIPRHSLGPKMATFFSKQVMSVLIDSGGLEKLTVLSTYYENCGSDSYPQPQTATAVVDTDSHENQVDDKRNEGGDNNNSEDNNRTVALINQLADEQQGNVHEAPPAQPNLVNTVDWRLKDGTPADNNYSTLKEFGIPVDNVQTTQALLFDLFRLQQHQRLTDPTKTEPQFEVKHTLHLQNGLTMVKVVKGNSESTSARMARLTSWIVNQSPNNAHCSHRQAIAGRLGLEDPESFLLVARGLGYCTQLTPKIPAEYWAAMCDDANLTQSQQRTIKAYMRHHLGQSIFPTENELRDFMGSYVPFECKTRDVGEFKGVKFSSRSPAALLVHHSAKIFPRPWLSKIEKVDFLFGGDHGKGAFSFLFVVIVRYDDGRMDLHDFQIGQIECAKDDLSLLRHLIEDMKPGIENLGPHPTNGLSKIRVCHNNHDISFGHELLPDDNSVTIPAEFFLIGDLKFQFSILGRDGYSGAHCLYCRLKQSEWIEGHKHNNNLESAQWTIQSLTEPFIAVGQNNLNDVTGQKEIPLLPAIPVKNCILPVLHLLLGLVNDVLNHFWEWIDERVDPLTNEEVCARNMAFLAEYALQQKIDKQTLLEDEYKAKAEARKAAKAVLASLHGLSEEQQAIVHQQYEEAVLEEQNSRQARDLTRATVKQLRVGKKNATAREKAIRKQRGKNERTVRKALVEVLSTHNVYPSTYHGGALEGPDCRLLMANAIAIFDSMSIVVNEAIENEQAEAPNNVVEPNEYRSYATPLEVSNVCGDHGRLLVLLDKVFSMLKVPRGAVSADFLVRFDGLLEVLRKQWIAMKLRFTPKCHLLLNHSSWQLGLIGGGFSNMGEDILERFHQVRARNDSRYYGLRNHSIKMGAQAKVQDLQHCSKVAEVKLDVNSKRKRKLSRVRCLALDNKEARYEEADAKRRAIIDQLANEGVPPTYEHQNARDQARREFIEHTNRNNNQNT